MKLFQTLHQRFLMLFVVTIVALIAHGMFSMNSMLSEQSRAQQKTVAPAIELVVEHLTKPLHISQAIAKSESLINIMQNPELEKDLKVDYLKRLESEQNMSFFIASEATRVQLNSDGSSIDLLEDEVNWYFKYKAVDEVVSADIGKWEDVHFYIDVKVFDEDDTFLGFFGTSKRLASFLQTFEKHRNEYGIEFFFVNAAGQVMLASDANLNPQKSGFTQIQDIDWYDNVMGPLGINESDAPASLHNQLVAVDSREYMISQFSVNNFAWQLYLVTPVQFKPSPFNLAYLSVSLVIVLLISGLFLNIYQNLAKLRKNKRTIKLPKGFLQSDDEIHSLIEYKSYTKPSHLVMIRLLQEHPEAHFINQEYVPTNADISQRLMLSSKVSHCLNTLLQQTKGNNLLAKSQHNEWLMLFQDASYVEINKHIKDIKHALDTLHYDVERQTAELKYGVAQVELTDDANLVQILSELEVKFDAYCRDCATT